VEKYILLNLEFVLIVERNIENVLIVDICLSLMMHGYVQDVEKNLDK